MVSMFFVQVFYFYLPQIMPSSSIDIVIFSDEERFYHLMDGIDCSCSLCVGKWNIFISGCDDFASPRDHVTRGNITVTKPCRGTKIIITAPWFYFRDEEGIHSCNFTIYYFAEILFI